MPTPNLPILWTVTSGTFGVQNLTGSDGTVNTYVIIKDVPDCQIKWGNTESPAVVFKIDRNIIPNLTASLSRSVVNSGSQGCW